MITLLFSGQYLLFGCVIAALVLSLSCHEAGHAGAAKLLGDDTAARLGRLTLNPIKHLDPVGLAMVVLVGFGFAKPVPVDPRNFRARTAELWVAAAGPGMNLLLAVVVWNAFLVLREFGVAMLFQESAVTFVLLLVQVNLLLMLFNLIPLGPLDGHYILPYFLPAPLARAYLHYNDRYGTLALIGLIVLSILGVPIVENLLRLGYAMLPLITLPGVEVV